MTKPEEILQEKVANYLVQNYPDVLFHSDYGSGAKLTKGQSAKQKRLNGGRRTWPDMFIAKMGTIWRWEESPTGVFDHLDLINLGAKLYGAHGLFIELKKDNENIFAQRNLNDPDKISLDGKVYADKHIKEQADVLYKLRQAGYCAEFAVGFDEAIDIITDYLGGPRKQEIEF